MFRNNRHVYRDLPTRENGSGGTRGNNSFRVDCPCPVTLAKIYSPRDCYFYTYIIDFNILI